MRPWVWSPARQKQIKEIYGVWKICLMCSNQELPQALHWSNRNLFPYWWKNLLCGTCCWRCVSILYFTGNFRDFSGKGQLLASFALLTLEPQCEPDHTVWHGHTGRRTMGHEYILRTVCNLCAPSEHTDCESSWTFQLQLGGITQHLPFVSSILTTWNHLFISTKILFLIWPYVILMLVVDKEEKLTFPGLFRPGS